MVNGSHLPDIVRVVDVESNGNSPPEIVELSIVTIAYGILDWPPATWMIKSQKLIRTFATRIHGITDADVSDSPLLQSVKDEILQLLQNYPVVAHNAHIDRKLLKLSFPNWQPSSVHDTLRLARFVVPQLSSHCLAKLIDHFGISDSLKRHDLHRAHRASHDAVAAGYLFLALIKLVAQNGISVDEVLQVSDTDSRHADPAQGSLF